MGLLSSANAESVIPPPNVIKATGLNVNFAKVVNKVNQFTTFVQIADKQWVEKNSAGKIAHRYNEISRNAAAVTLHDSARELRLMLDMKQMTLFLYTDWKNSPVKRDIGLIDSSTAAKPNSPIAPPSSLADCLKVGGQWKKGGLSGAMICVTPTGDAGKSCTDSGQCEMRCLYKPLVQGGTSAVVGQCQADTEPFGCFQEMKLGEILPKLCRD